MIEWAGAKRQNRPMPSFVVSCTAVFVVVFAALSKEESSKGGKAKKKTFITIDLQ